MSLVVTNSLSGKKEPFIPMIPGEVKMYVCGPTVYNFIHIGNARPFIFFDVVHRYLEYVGYHVTRVMNFTDVDDKIINRAREEKTTCDKITEKYIAEFYTDMNLLGIKPPAKAPRVTETIPEIIHLIEGLIKNGAAYVADDGEVFFSVRDFQGYGKLSGKNIDDLLVGARVAPGEKKRDPLDFSLWKPQKAADEPAWESPWCKGRPGWHIECSAMSMLHLGESFDLHGGGRDLIHPHHENEIAQSEAFTHKQYVKYWMHNNMLTFNAEKMSKSIGNIILTREYIEKYSAESLRFLLLSGQYRATIDYSEKHVRETQAALHRFYTTKAKCEFFRNAVPKSTSGPNEEEQKLIEFGKQFELKWREAMDDDFNTARPIGTVFEYVRAMNAYLDKKGFQPTPFTNQVSSMFLDNLSKLSSVLNLFGQDSTAYLEKLKSLVLAERGLNAADIEDVISKRLEARQKKDFAVADKLRNELLQKGVELRDKGNSTEWDITFQ